MEAGSTTRADALRAAEGLQVPAEELEAFAELYAALSEAKGGRAPAQRDLAKWQAAFARARACAHVHQFVLERSGEIDALCEAGGMRRELVEGRLMFAGVYGTRLSLPEALERVRRELQSRGRVDDQSRKAGEQLTVTAGAFDARHAAIRARAYPYTPACSARAGDATIDCLESASGELLGYLAMEGGTYVDDLAVLPRVHGAGVAKALVCGAARQCLARGERALSLDVRACNLPAFALYRGLGFAVGSKYYPAFYDWHGGYSCEATDLEQLAARMPAGVVVGALA
jgi:ribosomal protein S18 acetylase RimI-like enzyme